MRKRSGVAPAAVWPEGKGYGRYAILTMWDTGSLILALVSARAIGIISEKEFDRRIKDTLRFLRRSRFRWGKARLPNYRTDIVSRRPAERGYDATDIGRLLTALHVLDKATNGAYHVGKLVSRWDIEATIEDGRLYDIKSGNRFESRSNNYHYYIARAHRLWGFEVDRGYQGDLSDATDREAFVERVVETGTIASEPNANELIELGPAPHATVLGDIIYKAQQGRYNETGQLTSISEAPIDRKPWFTYQGFDRNGYGTFVWPVHSSVTDEKWQTEEFADRFRMVNSKAAFLWHALRDDDYAPKLRDYISAEAKTGSFGFAPGIYEQSGGKPNLMDINTNAMILEAIAYRLNGQRPLASLRL